uniref:amino acid adenylation domain-containing protein n=1 Tax=uncultured Shewanella sp. TaxID=173975 RepID=UPI00261F789A
YVIYTSGTTGQPKGVMMAHVGIINRLHWMQTQYPLSISDTVLQKTPYIFDVSVWELLWAHQVGAKLVIASPMIHTQPLALHQLILAEQISVLHFVPSMLDVFSQQLIAERELISSFVKRVFCSGEALTENHVDIFTRISNQTSQLTNLYGPTEAAIDVTHFDVCLKQKGGIFIGSAIDNIKLYVLNDSLSLVPIGMPGELYIGGVGLARGYLNRPELTVERFIENPFANEKDIANGYTRLYKTGDLVRYLPDGNLEYLGRNDEQVKIRGHRIELGEIQAALERLGGIKQAVMIDYKTDNSHFIAAYIVPDMQVDSIYFKNDRRSLSRHLAEAELSLDIEGVKQSLTACLPEYMLPTSFTVIDAVPLTHNGKLDKKALPEPMLIDISNYSPPRNELEQQLCQIWQDVLGLDQVGVDDNFFHIGGDSIKAIRLVNDMKVKASLDVSLVTLFTQPKISSLSGFSEQGQQEEASLLHALTPVYKAKDNLIMIHPGTAGAEVYHPLAVALSPRFNCIGIDNHNLVSESKIGSLKLIALLYLDLIIEAELHNKPINILGWSLGGNIALEVAYQLELRGHTDVHIYLLDTVIHNDETRAVLNELDENMHFNMIQREVIDKNASQEYVDKILAAAPFESDIHQESLTGLLNHSKVTLFKAEEMMQNDNLQEELIELDMLINQLTDNNIQTVVGNPLKIVSIEDKHHINIIEAVEMISNHIADR